MLFLVRSNKIIHRVAPIKSLYRYMLTVITCILLYGVWWYCVHIPLRTINVSYTQENQTMRQQCDMNKQECDKFSSLENMVKDLHYSLDVYSVQTSCDQKETYINDIMHAIATSGLSLSAYNTEREIDKKTHIKSIMRLSLVGSYQQLLNFFEHMHTKKILLSCNNISLHASEPAAYTIACEFAFFSWGSKNPST